MPYLLKHRNPNSTFTFCTGGGGDTGAYGVTSVAQGALFSLASVICREKLSVRFNEVYLTCRVDYDSDCVGEDAAWKIKASDFARVFEGILANPDIRDSRISVLSPEDIDDLKSEKKLAGYE
jgi:hypothetical protein